MKTARKKKQRRLDSAAVERRFRASEKIVRQRQQRLIEEAEAANKEELRQLEAELLQTEKQFGAEYGRREGPRPRLPVVTEEQLIALGGSPRYEKTPEKRKPPPPVAAIVFGRENEARMIFKPVGGGRWKVDLEAPPSLEDTKRELSKAGRDLWDRVEQKPGLAFRAVQALLSCRHRFKAMWPVAQQDDPREIFIKAYLSAQEGEKLERQDRFKTALAKYRFAGSLIEELRKSHAQWQPAVVEYHGRKISEAILRLQERITRQTQLNASASPLPDIAPAAPESDAWCEPGPEALAPQPKETERSPDTTIKAAASWGDQPLFAIATMLNAIETTLEVLRQNQTGKLQLAFKLLRDSKQWPQALDSLGDHAWLLANELQRPPSKKELKDQFDPPQPPHHSEGMVRPSEFSRLLKAAGLSWLKRGKPEIGFR